jgi:RmlD substrate binding domain
MHPALVELVRRRRRDQILDVAPTGLYDARYPVCLESGRRVEESGRPEDGSADGQACADDVRRVNAARKLTLWHIRSGAARNKPTAWFVDELRQPGAAPELAEALWRIALLDRDDRAGAWHLPGPESLSRYEIAQREIVARGLNPRAIDAECTPPSAERPRHIVLEDSRARASINWSPAKVLCRG